jgi:Flp pilus assembly protein TadG
LTRSRGQSLLYAVLLLPTLMLIFALAVEVSALQMERLQLRYAVDLAAIAAATSVDTGSYMRSGRLLLDPGLATSTAHEYLGRNLARIASLSSPADIAERADVVVVNQVPAPDPFNTQRLDRPSVAIRIRVVHRFNLVGWIGIHGVDVTVASTAQIRT